ncbi:alanine racemase [Microbacterium luticocti]|uniref:alanine racemase n=1 Tax=Microbacterium luticocti TaxID=451764 RepID=UPI00041C8F61|nr:alanine racemase [Microbacterium luticocti]
MTAALHVDLDALAANLAVVRARVAPAAHMLVVKDDAYGHGLVPVVTRAWKEQVRWFGAFDVQTGLAVRTALGAAARIFVWQIGGLGEARDAAAEGLDLGVGDALLLEDVAAAASATGRPVRVHLKIDTGLHRNGVRPEQWAGFVARAAELERAGVIVVDGVWSHIAEASDAEDDQARRVFEWGWDAARGAGLTPARRHLAASAAAFARSPFRYDLVRVGAFAYGIHPAGGPDATHLGIRPIARLVAPVVGVGDQVRIGIGALDGLPSTLAGRVSVGTPAGARALVSVGDEVSTVAGWDGAAPGDEVVLYGPGRHGEATATGLAEHIDTIGEEIALRVSPRLPRRHRG